MPTPYYAILRVKRLLSSSDLDGGTRHGRREDSGTHYDPHRTEFNEHYGAARVMGPVDWADGVGAAVQRTGAIVRKGATVAAEFFVGATPEFFAPREGEPHFNMERVRAFADAVMSAFYERFGKAVVLGRLDLDEGSPHMTIVVLPTYTKITKNKVQQAVSYRKVFAGDDRTEASEKLIELQDWFAAKMAPLGLVRGVPKAITHREHLSHHQYAKRRRQEDESRAKALKEAQELASDLARRNRELKWRNESLLAMQIKARSDVVETTRLLLEASTLHAWIEKAKQNVVTKTMGVAELERLERGSQVLDKFEETLLALRREVGNRSDDAEDETPVATALGP